ncbi:hypothetical protein PGTDC60_1488 [Porphyromonas gingivalis TDC60]|nr:hypothetical protein PGTDC60_1488 [Porphyromonas gingivalis TDC60]
MARSTLAVQWLDRSTDNRVSTAIGIKNEGCIEIIHAPFLTFRNFHEGLRGLILCQYCCR